MNSSILGCHVTSSFKDGGSTSHPLVVALLDPPEVIVVGNGEGEWIHWIIKGRSFAHHSLPVG